MKLSGKNVIYLSVLSDSENVEATVFFDEVTKQFKKNSIAITFLPKTENSDWWDNVKFLEELIDELRVYLFEVDNSRFKDKIETYYFSNIKRGSAMTHFIEYFKSDIEREGIIFEDLARDIINCWDDLNTLLI